MSPEPRDHQTDDTSKPQTEGNPPAGPHAREDLIDNEKTPGTGALPDPQGGEADIGSD